MVCDKDDQLTHFGGNLVNSRIGRHLLVANIGRKLLQEALEGGLALETQLVHQVVEGRGDGGHRRPELLQEAGCQLREPLQDVQQGKDHVEVPVGSRPGHQADVRLRAKDNVD